jgi:NAD(P)-dependent dehydrogenase (short-subunit alcohol dehydrogenase family)
MALQIRRGLESERAGITPDAGELLYTTDEKLVYVGDGATLGGNQLLSNILEDTTPQLGGDLDVNGYKIVSAGNGNIELDPAGNGNIIFHGNLTIDTNVFELAKISKDYDIVINSALIPNFGQTRILQAVWTEWKVEKHKGHIISFGSAVDYFYRPDNRLYPIEKRALRDLNRSLSKHVNWYNSHIRCTYFSFGGVSTEKTLTQWGHFSHFEITEIANYTKWIIESPVTTNIDEFTYQNAQEVILSVPR